MLSTELNVNHFQDMSVQEAHVAAPLAEPMSKTRKMKDDKQNADASDCQLGAVIPTASGHRKPSGARMGHATAKRELLNVGCQCWSP